MRANPMRRDVAVLGRPCADGRAEPDEMRRIASGVGVVSTQPRPPTAGVGLRSVRVDRWGCPEGTCIDWVAVGVEDGEGGAQAGVRDLGAQALASGYSGFRAGVIGYQLGLATLADPTPKFPLVCLGVEPDFVSASKQGPPRS